MDTVYEKPEIAELGQFDSVTGALINGGDETHFPGWWRTI